MSNQDWATALDYFFSTIAQTFAALVAFVYVAAQQRIAWLDTKITTLKSATIYSMGKAHDHDKWMVSKTATQISKDGAASTSSDAHDYAKKLAKAIREIQSVRRTIALNLILGLFVILFAIISLALVPAIRDCVWAAKFALAIGSIVTLVAGFFIGKMSYDSLKVSLREDV